MKTTTMKCPFLRKWLASACNAGDRLYHPSPFQLKEYCKTQGHRKCPFYLGMLDQYADIASRRN